MNDTHGSGESGAKTVAAGANEADGISEWQLQASCMEYRVLIEQGKDGMFIARCPALIGCTAQGRTPAEAQANIKEAMIQYLAARGWESGHISSLHSPPPGQV